MAGNAPSNDLHILKIPLAFFGLHRGTTDPQAVQRLENYIAKLKKELHRHALKAQLFPARELQAGAERHAHRPVPGGQRV